MSRSLLASALCGCALLAAGCYKGETAPTNNKSGDSGPVWKTTGPWKAKFKTVVGDYKQLEKIIDDSVKAGKVVVVDFWSNWCKPCKEELPHLALLQKKYGDKVVCVSVNLNYDGLKDTNFEEKKAEAEQELRKRFGFALDPDEELNGNFVHFVSNQIDEQFYSDAVIKTDPPLTMDSGIPVIRIYSKTGKPTQITVDTVSKARPKKKRPGENTPEETNISYKLDVIPVVEKLLKE